MVALETKEEYDAAMQHMGSVTGESISLLNVNISEKINFGLLFGDSTYYIYMYIVSCGFKSLFKNITK